MRPKFRISIPEAIRITSVNFADHTNAKVTAHWMPWHGTSGHVPLLYDGQPYVSSDIGICDDQCARMKVMGITGVNVDYYGPDSPSALAAIHMLGACERAGLTFSICVDQGAVQNPATASYTAILNFCRQAFATSPAYLKDNGRDVFTYFGEPAGMAWGVVRASYRGEVAFIFQGNSGFTHAESDGSFGWVNPTTPPSNINLSAIDSFNQAAAANPTKLAFYPAYAGFDDSLASWGKGRFMTRSLDKTLKQTLAKVPATAAYILLSTWNDHEEGSGIETGVTVA